MPVVYQVQHRRTETPNAVMTTLASPTQGESQLSVWRVEMAPGAHGPAHSFDTVQVWTVVDGGAEVDLAADRLTVSAGDTLVLPADAPRQIHADAVHGLVAIACAPAQTTVRRLAEPGAAEPDPADGFCPDWIA